MMRWPVIGMLAVAGLAAFWVVATPIPELQEQLRVSQFWVLEALGLALIVTTIAGLAQIRAAISRHDRYLAAGLCAVTFAMVLIAPRTNRIFYDEQIYQGIARNLSDLHLAQLCNDGTVEYGHLQCWRHEYNKQPFGYPYAVSLGYRLAGASDDVAHWMNVLAAAATAGVLFLLTLLITDNRLSAGLAAFSFALIPEQLRWSHTAASEPSAAFLCALAMLAAAAFVHSRSTTALIWAACASSFAAYMRPEAVLIVPMTALAILVGAANEARHVRFWWVAALCLVLLVPEVAHMAAVRNQDWGASDQRFSLAYFANNLVTNGRFYLADHRFPAVLTVLAVAGVTRSRWTLVMVVWFLLFWGVFLFFYAGSYDYGADVRYSLMSYAPLAVLAGTGAGRIAAAVRRAYPALKWAGVGTGALLLFQSTLYLPWVRAVGEEAWAARADVEFAKAVARDLPANAIVLTHNPSMFHVWGTSAAQLSIAAQEPEYVRRELARRYAGGVYLHWNYWCNVTDPLQVRFCHDALAHFNGNVVREHRERDYRFIFYRVSTERVKPGRP
jgi:Dolichyl-phosphate-mannose-protein mannosyltransferase